MIVTIRAGDPSDAAPIAVLHRMLFVDPWPEADIAAQASLSGTVFMVAEFRSRADAAIVGYALGQVAADEVELRSIGLYPDHQGGGLGRRLLTDWEQTAARLGATRAVLEVAEDNRPARQLYIRQGYREVGRRVGYYRRDGGGATDALILDRSLKSVFA